MWKTTRVLIVITVAVLLVTGAGCTRNRNRTRASGEVTVGGQPVKAGRITFTLVGIGSTYSASIINGKYSIRGRRQLMAGEYDVRIESSSTGSGRGGYDRQWTERVSVLGFTSKRHDFHLQ